MAQLVEALRHYRRVPGSIPCRALGNFQVTYSFCPHSLAPGSTQPLTEMSIKEFPWGKVGLARTADNSAVLAVPNVKLRVEAQHSIPLSESSRLVAGSFTFIFYDKLVLQVVQSKDWLGWYTD